MAIELGKAYVQIVPSAKGISGGITNQVVPAADAAGRYWRTAPLAKS